MKMGLWAFQPEKCDIYRNLRSTLGEEVPSAGARGQGEEESSRRGGEE